MLAQGIRFAAAGGTIAVRQDGAFDGALDTGLVQHLAVGAVPLGLGRRTGRAAGHGAVQALRRAAHIVQVPIGGQSYVVGIDVLRPGHTVLHIQQLDPRMVIYLRIKWKFYM